MAELPTPAAKRALVDRCLRGDPTAQAELFARYREPLTRALTRRYSSNPQKEQLAEDLTGQVFLQLVRRCYLPLRNFDPNQGHLLTLLVLLARDEYWAQRRSRLARQQNHEVPLEGHDRIDPNSAVCLELAIEECQIALTEKQKILLTECLEQITCATTPLPMSAAKRKALSRLMKKLREFEKEP